MECPIPDALQSLELSVHLAYQIFACGPPYLAGKMDFIGNGKINYVIHMISKRTRSEICSHLFSLANLLVLSLSV